MFLKLIETIFLILFLQATGQSVQYEKETKIFADALNKYFKKSLPVKQTCYLIIPKTSCMGCSKSCINFINENKSSEIISIVAIDFSDQLQNYNAVSSKTVWIDSTNIFSKLNIHTRNTTIITINNKKIISIRNVEPTTFKSETLCY